MSIKVTLFALKTNTCQTVRRRTTKVISATKLNLVKFTHPISQLSKNLNEMKMERW